MKWGKNLISLVVAVIFSLSLILVPVVSQVSPVQAAVTWTKSTTSVTLDGATYVEDAWVIKDGATYKMWYTHGKTDLTVTEIVSGITTSLGLSPIVSDIASLALVQFLGHLDSVDITEARNLLDGTSTVIGYATSTDRVDWTVQDSEVLAGGSSVWSSVGAPCVIKVSDNDYRMWYTRVETDLRIETDVATDNLTTILTNLGVAGQRKDALLNLINSTRTVIGYATSDDGITWTVPDSEVLAGGGSAWDSVADPCVIKDGDTYKMWYTQGKTDVTQADLDAMDAATFTTDELLEILDGTSTVIGYTTSSDGIDWGETQEVHTGGTYAWDSVANPSVVQSSSYEMWYTQGTTSLNQANLSSLLSETADLAEPFWDILDAFGSGNITQLLNNLSTLEDDISTMEGLLGNTRTVIGYATSTLGTAWTVQSSQHLVGSSTSAWSSVAAPSVVKDGTTYYMWYTEGIDDLTVQNLVALVLGTDLPIGYAYYTPTEPTVGGGGGAPVVAPAAVPGIGDVTDFITAEGVFTETVTTESFDSLAQLLIDEGTKGLTKTGEPLSEISMTEMEEPPTPPADSGTIGLVYDFGPDGATFDPAITLTFTYDPALIPEGVAEENLVIAMWDSSTNKWVELDSIVDPGTNTITAKVSHFTAFTVLAYTSPAAFTTSALTISPTEVDIGEKVTITVLVANTGDLSGSYTVTLTINKVVAATKDVTLAGGASQKVTFTTAKDAADTYAVNVDGLTGSFTVKPPPAPPPVKPPPVVPPPVKPPPVVPPVVPPVGINWWLIGGIIAGVIVIGVVIWQVVTRRRA